jgi:hypothetical protein
VTGRRFGSQPAGPPERYGRPQRSRVQLGGSGAPAPNLPVAFRDEAGRLRAAAHGSTSGQIPMAANRGVARTSRRGRRTGEREGAQVTICSSSPPTRGPRSRLRRSRPRRGRRCTRHDRCSQGEALHNRGASSHRLPVRVSWRIRTVVILMLPREPNAGTNQRSVWESLGESRW